MNETETLLFEQACRDLPGIEALRLEASRLAVIGAVGDWENLRSIWHGSDGMRSQVADALESLGSDSNRFNEYYEACCRKLFRILGQERR